MHSHLGQKVSLLFADDRLLCLQFSMEESYQIVRKGKSRFFFLHLIDTPQSGPEREYWSTVGCSDRRIVCCAFCPRTSMLLLFKCRSTQIVPRVNACGLMFATRKNAAASLLWHHYSSGNVATTALLSCICARPPRGDLIEDRP